MQGYSFDPWPGKIPHAAWQLSPRAATTEACIPWSPCSTTREATSTRSLGTVTKDEPLLAATKENPHAMMQTQHSSQILKRQKNLPNHIQINIETNKPNKQTNKSTIYK